MHSPPRRGQKWVKWVWALEEEIDKNQTRNPETGKISQA
jgi:hypothetical protein